MKKRTILCLLLTLMGVLSGCGTLIQQSAFLSAAVMKGSGANPQALIPAPELDPAVVSHSGRLAVYNDKIYFINSFESGSYGSGAVYSMNTDGSDRRKLSDFGSHNLCVYGNRIYCAAGEYDLRSMDIAGGDERIVTDDLAYKGDFVIANNGEIFYPHAFDHYVLYKIKTDGSNQEIVGENKEKLTRFPLDITGGRLYFSVSAIADGITSLKMDGTDKVKFADDYTSEIAAGEGWVCYTLFDGWGNPSGLYVVRTDGSDKRELDKASAGNLKIVGGRVYYTTSDNKLYSVNFDGTDRKINIDSIPDNILIEYVIYGEKIYYMLSDVRIYVTDINGGSAKIVDAPVMP